MESTIVPVPTRPNVSLTTLAFAYLRVGTTAFGFTILQQLKSLVLGRGWLTEEELILSALYFAAGNLPWVHPLFLGLEAIVVGIIFNVTLDLGARNIQNRVQAVIALFAFVALLFKANAILIVIVALALGVWLIRPAASAGKSDGIVLSLSARRCSRSRVFGKSVCIWPASADFQLH